MKQKPIQFFLRCHDFHTSNSLCICGKGLFVEPVDLEYMCFGTTAGILSSVRDGVSY